MASESVTHGLARAGFWRRVLALIIDMAVVLIPLQLVVAILYANTNGSIQGNFGLTVTSCWPLTEIPAGLEPAPPEGFNGAAECRSSLLGFETGRALVVSKTTQNGSVTTSISQTYALDASGQPSGDVFDVTWIALLLLLAYLVVMETRFGRTVGKRVAAIRVVEAAYPDRSGIPAGKALLRQIAMWIGLAPGLIASIVMMSFFSAAELEPFFQSPYFVPGLIIFFLIGLGWIVWIVVSLVRKRDPVYDRIAGTSVLRT
ncbi:RDD family protein [Kumtagia ephedrae]|uniref:RDD domain-containing protein n=1 Tax=Kumtagia ephedrae TaxID=2116701 RepID=A0A2P7S444_9HYPH|nr:RDD family protein [Mesorhizobium ephedrae]PSJ57199.1 hypothetical protein C7I84_18295 [Mesorhizobium ephedrae]